MPVEYIKKAELRINGGEFRETLQDDSDATTGRYDTRFSGPTMDPLNKEANYDPQQAAIGSAYVSAFNDYVRKTLKYDDKKIYRPMISLGAIWDYQHQPPGSFRPLRQATNVLPDLAWAMKYNPNLKVQLNAGYFDLVVHTRQMTPVGSFPEAALDASFRGRDEQVRGCRALEAYH